MLSLGDRISHCLDRYQMVLQLDTASSNRVRHSSAHLLFELCAVLAQTPLAIIELRYTVTSV
jgi:hypothetical protein